MLTQYQATQAADALVEGARAAREKRKEGQTRAVPFYYRTTELDALPRGESRRLLGLAGRTAGYNWRAATELVAFLCLCALAWWFLAGRPTKMPGLAIFMVLYAVGLFALRVRFMRRRLAVLVEEHKSNAARRRGIQDLLRVPQKRDS